LPYHTVAILQSIDQTHYLEVGIFRNSDFIMTYISMCFWSLSFILRLSFRVALFCCYMMPS